MVAADVGLVAIKHLFSTEQGAGAQPPIPLAPTSVINGVAFVRAVGFGSADLSGAGVGVRRYVDIPVASPDCSGHIPTQTGVKDDESWYGCHPDFEIVAGQPHLGKDTCHGDSGGPIFGYVYQGHGNYKEYLVGVTSRGVQSLGAQDCGDGGIYTRVDGGVAKYIRDQGVAITGE
jgi:hypothetical protein